jgi:hypothetical protein
MKASVLLSLIEKKVISELFECEGEEEVIKGLVNNAPKTLSGIREEILDLLSGSSNCSFEKRPSTLETSSESHIPKKIRKLKEKNKRLPNVYLKVNTNIVSNNIDSSIKDSTGSSNKTSLYPFNSKQTNLLFKGYFYNEEPQEICKEKLQKGLYCDDFYQNTYNKVNNLDQHLGCKRRKVCKKLFHILKILVMMVLII